MVEAAIAITERKTREGALKAPGGFLRSLLKDGTARQEAAAQRQAKSDASTRDTRDEAARDALVSAWEDHKREVAARIAADEGLDDTAVIDLARESLAGQPNTKIVLRTLEHSAWRGPIFEAYRTNALLERGGVRDLEEPGRSFRGNRG